MPDVTPYWIPGDTITCHASAAVTGGRFVGVSGAPVDGNPRVAHAGAAGRVIGVAARDAATGAKVMVFAGPGTIVPVEAGATLAAGADVSSDATGRAAAAGAIIAGTALSDAADAGATVMVRLI